MQVPKVFLSTIETLKDKTIEWERDKKEINQNLKEKCTFEHRKPS